GVQAADSDEPARSVVGEDEGAGREGARRPESACVSSSDGEVLVGRCAVEGAGSVGPGGVREPERGKDAARGVRALCLGVAPMIDAPDRAVRLVDRDASCGVDVLVVTTAQPRIDSDRSTPGGGGEWARSKGGDGQVRGNVTAVGERGV